MKVIDEDGNEIELMLYKGEWIDPEDILPGGSEHITLYINGHYYTK